MRHVRFHKRGSLGQHLTLMSLMCHDQSSIQTRRMLTDSEIQVSLLTLNSLRDNFQDKKGALAFTICYWYVFFAVSILEAQEWQWWEGN